MVDDTASDVEGDTAAAFARLKAVRHELESGDINEATTRLRLVDRVLFDILNWRRRDVEAEKYCRPGYADYVLNVDDAPRAIIEAKKEGVDFVLSTAHYNTGPIPFSLIASESPDACNAMEQASEYAHKLGCTLVGITNGKQWIMALSFVPGVAFRDRSVVVFESIDGIQKKFREFFGVVGPHGVASNHAYSLLVEKTRQPPPLKASAHVHNYPQPAQRNYLTNQLSYVLNMVWGEIESQQYTDEFLSACYVVPEASQADLDLAAELVEQRHQADVCIPDVQPARVESVAELPNVIQKPILVLGAIGHGKTTFLHYLRRVRALDGFRRYLQFNIDFLDLPHNHAEVANYIYEEVERQLLDGYAIDANADNMIRGAFHLEIERFKKSPEGVAYAESAEKYKKAELNLIQKLTRKREKHLRQLLAHLRKGQGKSISIFLDNLDRRDELLQEEAFLRASAIAREWGCLVFVCLRPDTFYKSQRIGVLDSLAPITLQVVAPDAAVVLKKRFNYAANIAKSDSSLPTAFSTLPSRLASQDLSDVALFFECCRDSFFDSTKLVRIFEAVSNGNIRKLLYYVRNFVTSRHLDTRKIIDRIPDGYRIPPHEAVRALLYRNSLYYDPKGAVFINVFDISTANYSDHFIVLMLLAALHQLAPDGADHGFQASRRLRNSMFELGFSQNAVEVAVQRVANAECVETRTSHDAHGEPIHNMRITALGRFHLGYLVSTFAYLDAVIVDTPITDDEARGKIDRSIAGLQIDDRIARARVFLSYLDQCATNLSVARVTAIWEPISKAIRTDISEIASRRNAR